MTITLPAEFRLKPAEAAQLLDSEVLARLTVHDLPVGVRASLLRAAGSDAIAGGRIYDAHIAEIARAAGASVVVTDNRRHFFTALKHGLRVETPVEFLSAHKKSKV